MTKSRVKKPSAEESQTPPLRTEFYVPYYKYTIFTRYFQSTADELGEGKFGVVTKAIFNNTEVAIKEMFFKTDDALQDCKHEKAMMEMLVELKAPNIVKPIAYTYTQHHYFLAMEYMPKGSLCDYMSQQRVVSWTLRYRMIVEITKALAFMHENDIVHRDLKSGNILLDAEGHAKLADFGLAKVLDGTAQFCGTAGWVAPEVILGKPGDTRSDIYSLATLMWEIAKGDGSTPFSNCQNVAAIYLETCKGRTMPIPDKCPTKIAKLITWGWRKDPAARPTAKEMEKELETGINRISSKLTAIEVPKPKWR